MQRINVKKRMAMSLDSELKYNFEFFFTYNNSFNTIDKYNELIYKNEAYI